MPRTKPYTLNADDVAAILKATQTTPPVQLVALDANWGPPVSGRTDTDFLQVWAAAATSRKPKRVSLSGARVTGEWNIQVDLEPVATVGDVQLFFAALGPSQYEFPSQFVIQMESEDGSVYCDNNGGYGVNYRLDPYRGRMTSAVVGDGAIWLLPKFTPFVLAARS